MDNEKKYSITKLTINLANELSDESTIINRMTILDALVDSGVISEEDHDKLKSYVW